jgi:hypothetical protein
MRLPLSSQWGARLCITNDPESPLAAASQSTIAINAGEERSIAATKTYSNQLMAIAMLSAALLNDEKRWRELRQVPGSVSRGISRFHLSSRPGMWEEVDGGRAQTSAALLFVVGFALTPRRTGRRRCGHFVPRIPLLAGFACLSPIRIR